MCDFRPDLSKDYISFIFMGRSEVLAPKGVLKFILYPIMRIALRCLRRAHVIVIIIL